MDNEPRMVSVDDSVYKLLCMLPGPPRCLYLTSLSKLMSRALPWLAILLLQASVVLVPGLLWCAAGSRRIAVPGTGAILHPSQTFYAPALMLCVYLLLAYAAMQYLKAARQRQAEMADTALTPESIISTNSDWQEAWPTDHGQGVPQGDASSLPADRSMQQPRDQTMKNDLDVLFSNIRGLKRRLYGSDADIATNGKRDLATAAAEIDRSVRTELNDHA
ncbi:hypothetical protein ABBQ32_013392 [Trebouxia sp. C0010 RCD-2024]